MPPPPLPLPLSTKLFSHTFTLLWSRGVPRDQHKNGMPKNPSYGLDPTENCCKSQTLRLISTTENHFTKNEVFH